MPLTDSVLHSSDVRSGGGGQRGKCNWGGRSHYQISMLSLLPGRGEFPGNPKPPGVIVLSKH